AVLGVRVVTLVTAPTAVRARSALVGAVMIAAAATLGLVHPFSQDHLFNVWTRGDYRSGDTTTYALVARQYPGAPDRGTFMMFENYSDATRYIVAGRWLEALYGRWQLDDVHALLFAPTKDVAALAKLIARHPDRFVVVTRNQGLAAQLAAL